MKTRKDDEHENDDHEHGEHEHDEDEHEHGKHEHDKPTPCFPPIGACFPVVPGAKHKMSREYKLAKLADGVRVPSSIAAGTMHMARRFLLGKTAANPLEKAVFATLRGLSRDLLSCTVAAFDNVPTDQRNRLFAESLLLDPNQPLDEATLSAALAQEIKQRVGIQVFGDPQGAEEERPGLIRVFPPEGEPITNQVRICTINDLRTASFRPGINIDDYKAAEIQQDCVIKIVDGQPQVQCQVRTAALSTDCPGNFYADGVNIVCFRVLDVAAGDSMVLEGVNFFSVDAKVRFFDKQTSTVVRDVDAHVWGDIDTPLSEEINGEQVLINDCRVHDRLTFTVPDDLPSVIYQIRVVVPNITGISGFGSELNSDSEFINVIPPATARFQIVAETIKAKNETSPEWFGSDEVGLHTLAAAFAFDLVDLKFQLVDLPDLNPPLDDPNKQTKGQEQKFKDIQDVDFDSGTFKDITRTVFEHDQQILGMLLVVYGDEIDSQDAYDKQITSSMDIFLDLVKKELEFVFSVGGFAGISGILAAIVKYASVKVALILAAIAAAIIIGIDIIVALWAPADPLIRDSIALSVNDLDALTSVSVPAPDPTSFLVNGIRVRVNNVATPPKKLPLEYHETREYLTEDLSNYEITYRYNRVA